MEFQMKKASRQGIKPLVGLYAESGCGKTYSALLLARGFVGPSGRIILIDSESGRGSLYADVLPGGYEVMDLGEPFSPMRYLDALRAAEASKAGIIIVDSVSHEWSGIGGVLDMAGESEAKSGTKGLHNWNKPKQDHNKMVNRLLQSPLPMIVCMRAKYKTRQVKLDGKTQIIKDEVTTPIQEDTFLFEMTLHAEILQNHTIIVTKASHPTLRDCLPADKERPITIADGEALAKWCASAGGSAPTSPAATQSGAPTVKELKAKLWELLVGVRGSEKTWLGAEQWLAGNGIITDEQTVGKLTAGQLADVISAAEEKLQQP
jgi:AAA domain